MVAAVWSEGEQSLVEATSIMFSLAICTRDSAERLPELFVALRALEVPDDVSWEVLVINNASLDETEAIARRELSQFSVPTQVINEQRGGLVFARDAAARMARGQWLAFLDDDNLPAPDWLAQAAIAVQSGGEKLGAFSGEVRAKWTVRPPDGIRRLENFLGCHAASTASFRYDSGRGVLPPGAGLVVRRAAWLAAVPPPGKLFFTGRISGHLLGGEDIECLTYLSRAGWESWHFPAMLILHVMSPVRVKAEYLMGLCRAGGLVRHHLRMMRTCRLARPFAMVGYLLADLFRLARHFCCHPVLADEDVVDRCLRQYLVGTLISPFYLRWWHRRPVAKVGGYTSGQKP